MRKVHVLILGCGRQGEKHLKALKKLENVEITVCETQKKRAEEIQRSYGVRCFLNYDEALEELSKLEKLVAVDVCTPTLNHYEHVMKALKAGAHVFCEKPLVPTSKQAEEIAELARKKGLLVAVGYLYRFHTAMRVLKNVLESGQIGEPYMAIFRIGGRGGHARWSHRFEDYGGAILELMTHVLDLALWYFGDVYDAQLAYSAIVRPRRKLEDGSRVQVTAEDLAIAHLRMASGVEVICEADQLTPSYMSYIEVMGTEGNILTSILEHVPTLVFRAGRLMATRKFSPVNMIELELEHFISCLLQEDPLRACEAHTAEDSVKLTRVVEKLREEAQVRLVKDP